MEIKGLEPIMYKLEFGEKVTDISGGLPVQKYPMSMLITYGNYSLLETVSDVEIDECGNKTYIINRQRFRLSKI